MTVRISYSLGALHEAAKFIWENNRSVPYWPSAPTSAFDVMTQIRNMMVKGALENAEFLRKEKNKTLSPDDDWMTFTGSGGYYVLYELLSEEDEEEIRIGIDVLVDPAVSHPNPRYVTEVVDNTDEMEHM